MTDLLVDLSQFHFLRPYWLAGIPVVAALWWILRRVQAEQDRLPQAIAAHLAKALSLGAGSFVRRRMIDGLALLLITVLVATAGPAWRRMPNPLVTQTAPLAVALEVSERMLETDVMPNRLERAKQKISDVLTARAGAKTALVAYAGSAHRVTPLTEDPAVLKPFLEGLSPDIMPTKGANATEALKLASDVLKAEATAGAILFVVSSLDRADLPAFEVHTSEGGLPIVFLVTTATADDLDEIRAAFGRSAIQVTADSSDVNEISRRVANAYRDALAKDERLRWDDHAWGLAWPIAFLTLLWFRRGWNLLLVLVTAGSMLIGLGGGARADGLIDWFLTPDQQGRLAYDSKRFSEAAERFEDPMWRGLSLYRAGKYEDAAKVFSRIETPAAAFNEGMSHVKSRSYRDGVRAFEKALERKPEFSEADHNLEVTKAIISYVERVREQSDTGEERGIGADEIVFDNEAGRGKETRVMGDEKIQAQSAEQWMRSVDTQTAEFLKMRFALEETRQNK
ncbi:MAG: VWA domain-containing protein [Hyphomicrobiaceae bacterium]